MAFFLNRLPPVLCIITNVLWVVSGSVFVESVEVLECDETYFSRPSIDVSEYNTEDAVTNSINVRYSIRNSLPQDLTTMKYSVDIFGHKGYSRFIKSPGYDICTRPKDGNKLMQAFTDCSEEPITDCPHPVGEYAITGWKFPSDLYPSFMNSPSWITEYLVLINDTVILRVSANTTKYDD